MGFYENMAATASSLITKFGKPITISRTVGETDDPVTGVHVTGTTTEYTPNGIFQTIKASLIDGTRIKFGDKMFVIDNSFTPLLTDVVPISGSDWAIEEITPVEPANLALVYFVRIRK